MHPSAPRRLRAARIPQAKRSLALLCLAPLALAFAACGSTVSTSGFTGEQRAVAQRIADLQSDVTSSDRKKVCTNDLAKSVVKGLGGRSGCESALKTQLAEIDNLEAKVNSVSIPAGASTATARVKSTYAGKSRVGTVSLIKEGKAWKVAAVQ